MSKIMVWEHWRSEDESDPGGDGETFAPTNSIMKMRAGGVLR